MGAGILRLVRKQGGYLPREPAGNAASKTSAEAPSQPTTTAADALGAGKDDTQAVWPQPKEKRARIYSGFCRLVVEEIEQAKAELEKLAVGSGGYVEAVSGPVVTLRVPAGRFAEVSPPCRSSARWPIKSSRPTT